MGMDYSIYNWYNFMNNVFRQVQNVSEGNSSAYQGTQVNGQSFADTFQNAAQEGLQVPESMDAIFEEAAQTYNVPVQLLKAIGKNESNFQPEVVSWAGAMGVMQLMPCTVEAMGVKDPFDPRDNIMGGAKCIAQKLEEYDGNLDLALASYSAGSGNVQKYGGIPPFGETQAFIRRVKQFMQEDLTIGKTVMTSGGMNQGYTGSVQNNMQNMCNIQGVQDSGYGMFTPEQALYMVELMKLQIQSKMTTAAQSILGGSNDSIF